MSFPLGSVAFEQQQGLSDQTIIGVCVAGGVIFIIIVIFVIYCVIKNRRNDDKMKSMRKEMDQLESRVANECKDGKSEI